MSKHGDMYAWISNRAFLLFMMDLDALKTKYQRSLIDGIRVPIAQIKRNQLVDALLVSEFGKEAIQDYKEQCKVWDESQKLARK